ncbi:MAG: phage portal protein [Desulfobacteraceae bacterium]|nr:MAG: phage portal protein [Desulfobacteraceae bacterium]
MGLFDIFKFRKKEAVPMTAIIGNGLMSSLITRNDGLSLYSSWVYGCIDRRAKGIANVEFKLYKLKRDGEVEEILEHEILDLLLKVNPSMTKFDFMQMSVIFLDIFGMAPWYLENGKKNNQPTGIYLLRPEYLTAKKDKIGNTLGYEYNIGAKKYEFEPEEIIELKNYNPQQPDKGLGIIEAVRMAATHNDYIKQHNTGLLKNGARPAGTLTTEDKIDKETHKRLKKQFKEQYQGYENAYKMLILEAGLKFEAISLPPKDLDFIESTKMNRDEIFSLFGVNKPIMGIFDDINRASAYTAEYLFARQTLEPMATKYVEQLNEFLVPRYGDDLWLSFEPLAKNDADAEVKRREAAWNKWMTTNECRAEIGLEPVKGGDMIYMGMSNMPMIGGEQGQKNLPVLEGKSADIAKVDLKTQRAIKKRILNRSVRLKRMIRGASEKAAQEVIGRKKVLLKIVPEKKELSQDQIDAFYKLRMADEGTLEGKWEKTFINHFEAQKGRFLGKIEGKKSAVEDYDIDVEEELKTTIDIINPLMYETVMKGTQHASELIGESAILDMDFIKDWLDGVAEKTGESITNTTIEAFEEAVKESVAAGESINELKNRVEDIFEFAKGTRATMIARTETARGVTEAHRKMYEYYGFTDVKWLLSPGACEDCIKKAYLKWTVKNIEGQIPVHPNCKCDHTPI